MEREMSSYYNGVIVIGAGWLSGAVGGVGLMFGAQMEQRLQLLLELTEMAGMQTY